MLSMTFSRKVIVVFNSDTPVYYFSQKKLSDMIDALIKRASVNAMKCTRIGGKKCNCSCFEIDQEMDAILLIIGIVYRVCRIVIKSVQQCTYFLFSVNLLSVGVNYGKRTMQVCS